MKIFSIGNEKNALEGNLTEYEGRKCIDIRNWYLDKKTSEMKPTQKGLTLTKAKYFTLIDELFEHSKEVGEWFSIDSLEKERKMPLDSKINTDLDESIQIKFDILPSHLMYDLEIRGTSRQLIINSESSFGFHLKEMLVKDVLDFKEIEGDRLLSLIINLILSFQKAANRLCSEEKELKANEFIADLNLEWKRIFDTVIIK